MRKKLVHGSTFSGIGAPEIAADMLGWSNAFHCEINPFGRSVLDYYFPNAESYEDITKTDFSKWRGRIDVLTGGFPCQPFSYAGKRRGSEDDRYLWPFMLRCIQQIRPTWFVGENVAGIATMVFPGEDAKMGSGGTLFDETNYMVRDERYVIEEICEQLERERYSVQPMLIPACAVGAPHRRDRIFFIAHRDDSEERTTQNTECLRCEELGKLGIHRRRNSGTRGTARPQQQLELSGIAMSVANAESEQGRCSAEREPCKTAQEQLGRRRSSKDGTTPNTDIGTIDNGQSGIREDSKSQSRQFGKRDGEEIARVSGVQETQGSHSGREETLATDTKCNGRPQRINVDELTDDSQEQNGRSTGKCIDGNSDSIFCKEEDRQRMSPEERWRCFPTISPIYRGNDGLPFDVDNLTIPFSEWRKESLKAYGNAIVVQVMYEIFKTIDLVENSDDDDL